MKQIDWSLAAKRWGKAFLQAIGFAVIFQLVHIFFTEEEFDPFLLILSIVPLTIMYYLLDRLEEKIKKKIKQKESNDTPTE